MGQRTGGSGGYRHQSTGQSGRGTNVLSDYLRDFLFTDGALCMAPG